MEETRARRIMVTTNLRILMIKLLLLSTVGGAKGFRIVTHQIIAGRGTGASTSTTVFLQSPSPPSPSSGEAANAAETTTATLTKSEIKYLFQLISDETLLYDPSRGTCCRSRCSGCNYLDPVTGNFLFDEYAASSYREGGDDDDYDDYRLGGWLAPYVMVNFGERVHASNWSRILFRQKTIDHPSPRKEVEKDQFASLLGISGSSEASSLAVQSLWDVLSPSAGYPRLSTTDITQAIKGMEGSDYAKGGAVNFASFERGMVGAADRIVHPGSLDGVNGACKISLDYDSMSKEELLEECTSRGMKTSFPKMMRIIIEELRFYDANGRQGIRHPVKNTLS